MSFTANTCSLQSAKAVYLHRNGKEPVHTLAGVQDYK